MAGLRVIQLLIFVLPWIAWPGRDDPFHGPKEATLLVGGWALLIWTWLGGHASSIAWKNVWLKRFALWALFFGAWRFWVPFLNHYPTDQNLVYNLHIWLPTLSVLMGMLLLHCLTTTWLAPEINAVLVTQWWCYSAVAVAVYALFQWLGIEQFYVIQSDQTDQVWFAGFGNVGLMASFLAPLTPLFLLFREKRYLVGLVLVLAALALPGSRYAQVAAGISVGTYALLRLNPRFPRWIKPIIVTALLLGVGFGLTYAWTPLQRDERWPIWKATWQTWKEENAQHAHYSWTGRGLQTFPEMFSRGSENAKRGLPGTTGWMTPHNDGLQALFEWGIVGVALLLMGLWGTIRSGWEKRLTPLGAGWLASLMGFLFLSLTYFPWHFGATAWLGLMIMAMNERSEVAA